MSLENGELVECGERLSLEDEGEQSELCGNALFLGGLSRAKLKGAVGGFRLLGIRRQHSDYGTRRITEDGRLAQRFYGREHAALGLLAGPVHGEEQLVVFVDDLAR